MQSLDSCQNPKEDPTHLKFLNANAESDQSGVSMRVALDSLFHERLNPAEACGGLSGPCELFFETEKNIH